MSEDLRPVLLRSPSPEGPGTNASQRPHVLVPTCSPSGMAWEHPRQTKGLLPRLWSRVSSQKGGESGTVSLSLFARGPSST